MAATSIRSSDAAFDVTYGQYARVLASGEVALEYLERIVRHDGAHSWSDPSASARQQVLLDAKAGKLKVAKDRMAADDPEINNRWPLPLYFGRA